MADETTKTGGGEAAGAAPLDPGPPPAPRYVVAGEATVKGAKHTLYLTGDLRRPLTYDPKEALAYAYVGDARAHTATFDQYTRHFGMAVTAGAVVELGAKLASQEAGAAVPALETTVQPAPDYSGRDGSPRAGRTR